MLELVINGPESPIYPPEHKVVVRVIDNSWNTSIRVVLGVSRLLVFPLLEVKVDGLVCESKFLKEDSYFPAGAGKKKH